MILPPPPSGKPLFYYDTECYVNLWLLKIRIKHGPMYTFTLHPGETLSASNVTMIRWLFENFTCISFNGIYYDVAMIAAALNGYTPDNLKWQSDQLIIHQVKPWELNIPQWKPSDHIDLIEVLPGAGSQKTYAGRIHCKRLRDLPFEPERRLSPSEALEADDYCGHDLFVLESLHDAAAPQLEQRERLSERYGIDLRSKSDAQLAETVLKLRCEQALGRKIYKPEIDWNLRFRYEPPAFLMFQLPNLQTAFRTIQDAVFGLGANGAVEMPPALEGLSLVIGSSVYRMGIGGLHSSEKCQVYRSNETHILMDADVASYYPNLILNSGKYPKALGATFLQELRIILNERLAAKDLEKLLKKSGRNTKDPAFVEGYKAHCENEGGKIMINGTFGKTGSPFSVLFAPEMLIQTTITGQLSLLMLIEWLEMNGIKVVSANTDGIVMYCPRTHTEIAKFIIKAWEQRTGLEMDTSEYQAVYSRDVNNYFLVKDANDVKRKGQYSKAGLVEKKNPHVEICADAVEEYLSKGIPLIYTIGACRDIRKFVSVRKVNGGAVKLWGEGPRKDAKVRDIEPVLIAQGWMKRNRKWYKPYSNELINSVGGGTGAPVRGYEPEYSAKDAYQTCFQVQTEEYVGKVIRFYYSRIAPGPIVYASNGNTVSLSYGARPCMVLPDDFPGDIDYDWYVNTCEEILEEIGCPHSKAA